ncbi:MAG: 4-(cytidine 5'-diphospho)-2-C-methyl-D-erythritol kinase [Opitutales bacterium]|tara:strand:+ start:285 stop:1190 length:906 start_codon:yes stop_codon:yes gene_type:complete
MTSLSQVRVLAPAKINLFLAVTGVRPDGFHELVSLVVPVDVGDVLDIRLEPELEEDQLDLAGFPVPGALDDNLVMRAIRLFRKRVPEIGMVRVQLKKKIPVGAGLGGGSSDAVAALKAMNALCGEPLSREVLIELATELGSDCPLFVDGKPVWMRGRGEVLMPVSEALAEAICALRFVIFKPAFGVDTAWAYSQLRKNAASSYVDTRWAEAQVRDWEKSLNAGDARLFNSFERPVSMKYPALAVLLDILRKEGFMSVMSGSGSACFLVLQADSDCDKVYSCVREAWGADTFMIETRAQDRY